MRQAAATGASILIFVSALCGAACGADGEYGVDQSLSHWFGEPADAASALDCVGAAPAAVGANFAGAQPLYVMSDPAVQPAQMLPPTSATAGGGGGGRQYTNAPVAAALAGSGLSSVPYMIGDTGAGTCVDFNGLLDIALNHPTLGCARLNISEANTPLPIDRVYYSYRHFHNASSTEIFQFDQSFDVDRHTIAGERTFWDQMCSVEIRLPIEYRLNSNLLTNVDDDFDIFEPLSTTFVSADANSVDQQPIRRAELANMSLIFKALLMQRETWAMSGGLGVTLPTARDVSYGVRLNTTLVFPDFPGVTADTDVNETNTFSNETVYLAPFLGWLYAPDARWYHQGFLQVEVAANPSRVTSQGGGTNAFFVDGVFAGSEAWSVFNFPTLLPTEIHPQTLMRLNLGWGYNFYSAPREDWLREVTGIYEVHYTTTLNDAVLSEIPTVEANTIGTPPLQELRVGNTENRVDIVNMCLGVTTNVGGFIVTNAAVAPIRQERGYDFEYNLQVQRPF